ncbi:MAG: hypothetical protein LJF30_04225 [Acidobacteria bacterium]|nr:hypothetical protein [Acidobacteriota bacterium]
MWGRAKTLVLAAVVGSAALVPLFGDPRTTPVTHPLWGRMLLRALEMNEAVRVSTEASRVFSTLAWRDSLSFPADRFLREDGAVVREEAGRRVMAAVGGPAELVYPLAVVQPGDYQLRTRLSGAPDTPASAELARLEGGGPLATFALAPQPTPEWVLGGTAHLDPGTYGASVLLPPGCTLSQVEVAPPCLNPIEPPGGWEPTGVTTVEDLAVTALKALDMEYELPPAAEPLEIRATQFQVEGPPEAIEARASAETLEEQALRAGARGLRAIVAVEIPEPGVYSLYGFVTPGSGQRWLVDACRKAMVCPGEGGGWRAILTQPFSAGRHSLLVTLGSSAVLEMVRIELKKVSPPDYVATLRRIGFDPGPDGPISPDTAIAAMEFIRDKRLEMADRLCGDIVVVEDNPALPPPPTTEVAEVLPPIQPPPVQPPITPVPPPIGPPILPPQPPASPTTPSGG